MRPLSAPQLFDLWERGLAQPPAVRARALLAAASPGVAPEELDARSVGRRDADLLRLRAATFGPELRSRAACAACGAALEWSLDAEALLAPGSEAAPGEGTLDADGFAVRFRCPTAGDLAVLATRASSGGVAGVRHALLARCVLDVRRGEDGADLESLPEAVFERLAAAMAEADPAAEMRVSLACPECGTTTQALFDVVSFFWTEIEAWVARTAHDVHALASAYGWRESDVLAMGPARRRLYLSLAGR